jgi:hypothetical protein
VAGHPCAARSLSRAPCRRKGHHLPGTHLTAAERETVILLDDESDVVIVTSWQRRIITRLEKNPVARKVEDMRHGSTVGARFELPVWSLSFRSKKRTGTAGNPENFRSPRLESDAEPAE